MHEEETESIIITTDPTTEILEHVEMIETSIEEVIEVNEFKLDAGNSADLQVTFSSSDSTGKKKILSFLFKLTTTIQPVAM